MEVALFVTCLADALFPEAGRTTVSVLERLGHDVVFPNAQTCCGQMHTNTGYGWEALALLRHHVQTFEKFDAIVAPSGSCVGAVRHQHQMLALRAGDEGLAARVTRVATHTWELSEFLVDMLGVEDRRLCALAQGLSPHGPMAMTVRRSHVPRCSARREIPFSRAAQGRHGLEVALGLVEVAAAFYGPVAVSTNTHAFVLLR